MAICNLLSLTVRKNQNYEPEAMTVNQVYANAVNSSESKAEITDSLTIKGRVMDIMGNMSDEELEAVYKVGFNTAVNEMVEIITTCTDITDKELIEIFLGKTNPTSAPKRLRIVRTTVQPTPPAPGDDDDDDDKIGDDDTDNDDDKKVGDNDSDNDPGDGTDGTGPINKKTSTKDLYRGDPEWSTTIKSTETVLTLKNPFTGSDYQYTITSLSGNQTAAFEFLANGRLLITANNIKVVSSDNQKDDIILIGNNNELDTGDSDDIVRVGYAVDSKDIRLTSGSQGYIYTTNEFGVQTNYYLTNGNKVNSGSGNDYVVMLGNNYEIDTGDNNDKVRVILSNFTPTKISNAEDVREYDTQTSNFDGKDGWACQGTIPDCRFFALINSIGGYGNKNNGDVTGWALIEDKGSSYRVTFPNYPAKSGKKNYIDVSKSSVSGYDGVYGDLDTIIISRALNDIIATNKDRSKVITYNGGSYTADDSVTHAYYNTIAKYVTGSEYVTWLNPNGWTRSCEEVYGDTYQNCFSELWNKYKSGEISNFTLGISSEDKKLGIVSGHAYSVVEYNESAGYIEITNPWDDADCLRLSLTDFFALDTEVMVYGADIYHHGLLVPNGGSITYLSPNNIQTMDTEASIAYYGGATEEVGYVLMDEETSNPFANLFTDNEPEIYDEITEITESIEAVKEILEEKKTLELYS